jgi:hypothetical protein
MLLYLMSPPGALMSSSRPVCYLTKLSVSGLYGVDNKMINEYGTVGGKRFSKMCASCRYIKFAVTGNLVVLFSLVIRYFRSVVMYLFFFCIYILHVFTNFDHGSYPKPLYSSIHILSE